MTTLLNILIVEDAQAEADLWLAELRRAGFDPQWKRVQTEPDYRAEIKKLPDLILAADSLLQLSGLRAAELLQASGRDIPLILVSGTAGEEAAVEAMKHGAADYLLKDRLHRLGTAVHQALAQKRLRDERQQAEDERGRLFNLSLDMLCVAGFDGRLKQVNPAWTECLGWTAEELTSRSMLDFILTEDHAATSGVRQQIHQGTPVRGFENRYRCKDGSYRWLSWSVYPLMQSRRVFAVARDITERKQVEETLRNNEQEQRQLARQLETERARLIAAQAVAKVGTWETDLSSLSVAWSEETHRIFETDPATFRPSHQGFLELVHPEDRAAVNEAFVQSTGRRGTFAIEHRLLLPDGRIKFIAERWLVFQDDHGEPVRAIGTCQDITERKQADEKNLRQLRELQRWHETMLGREDRILELKHEVNELLAQLRQPARYAAPHP